MDEKDNRHQYIFRRGGSLIMSLNGKVQMGTWEYIAPSNALLINRGPDIILLKHAFLESGLMVMKLDGQKDEPWVLINEKLVPDLDVERYLKTIFISKNQLKTGESSEGKKYYYSDPYDLGISSSTKFYDENLEPYNGKLGTLYPLQNAGSTGTPLKGVADYELEAGNLKKTIYRRPVSTKAGEFDLESVNSIGLNIGDKVLSNNSPVPDGKYRVIRDTDNFSIRVKGGHITKTLTKGEIGIIIFIGGLLLFVLILVVANAPR